MGIAGNITIKEVDKVEVTTLLDNYVDLMLESTEIVTRPPLTTKEELPTDTLLAEHGLSLLVTVLLGDETHTVLLDTGYNETTVLHNMEMLGTDPGSIDAIVLSHAHMDHGGGLFPILEKAGDDTKLMAHPDVFAAPRTLKMKNGATAVFPKLFSREALDSRRIRFVETPTPTAIAGGTVVVTGGVERTVPFEQGMPNAFMEKDGEEIKDIIPDDQSLVLLLKNKGIVLITGCCHAGIVNTVRYAQKLTGVEKVHAIMGGLHLSGAVFEPIADDTIDALQQVRPQVLVPMHCTGWRSMQKLERAFPEAFIINSVGSVYTLV